MTKAAKRYAEKLDDILSDPITEEVDELTGEEWRHPYVRDVPNDVTLNDLRELRRLQRLALDGEPNTYMTAKEFSLLTAGLVTSGPLTAQIPATEARETYKNLPRIDRNRNRLRNA